MFALGTALRAHAVLGFRFCHVAPSTPAVAIENAGRPEARAIPGSLGELGGKLAEARFDGPVVLIIGEVAARADAWLPAERPLEASA